MPATASRLLVMTGLLMLGGCGDKYEQREERLKNALHDNEDFADGFSSRPAWLVKHSFAGQLRNAAFFGYIDNLVACQEFAEAYNDTYPEVHYSCETMSD